MSISLGSFYNRCYVHIYTAHSQVADPNLDFTFQLHIYLKSHRNLKWNLPKCHLSHSLPLPRSVSPPLSTPVKGTMTHQVQQIWMSLWNISPSPPPDLHGHSENQVVSCVENS